MRVDDPKWRAERASFVVKDTVEKTLRKINTARRSSAIILRERQMVVIIREFRTVPAHRLFCFAASRPVRARTVHGHNLAASRFVGESCANGKWPGSSGGRAQPCKGWRRRFNISPG